MTRIFLWSILLSMPFLAGCSDNVPEGTSRREGRVDSTTVGSTTTVDSTPAATNTPARPVARPTKTDPKGKYGIPAARVIYFNSRTDGYDTLFFDQFGAREAYYTAAEGQGGKARKWVALYADGVFVQYDARVRGGDRVQRPQPTGPLLGFMPDLWDLSPEMARIYQTTPIQSREVLGRTSEGFSFTFDGRREIYLWEGIPLYHRWNDLRDPTAPALILEAKDIDTTTPIPESRFTVPRGVVLTDKSTGP